MKKSIFVSVIFALVDVILTVAIILTAFPVTEITAFAAEDLFSFNDELAAIKFDSYENFQKYVTSSDSDFEADGNEPEVAEYLRSIDGIFIPNGISTDDINGILITPSYIELSFVHDGVKMQFSFYYDEVGGKMTYDNSKSGRGNGTMQSGDIIYYTAPYFGDYETYYVWQQDGNYFQLRISGNHGDKYLSMCNAVMNGFDDAARSGDLQKIGGKIYYVYPDGSYAKGWLTVDGNKYYFRSSGAAVTKNTVIEGIRYKFNSDGVCTGKYSGWVKKSGKYYYYKNGEMKKNCWIKSGGKRTYYLTEDGSRAVGTIKISGKNYTFDENGKLQ